MGATTTADFRNGMVIRYNGELYTVVEFHHVSPGNWRAFVRVRLKNVKNGRVMEQRFRAGEGIEDVRVEHQNWQFLYVDGDDYIFVNYLRSLTGGLCLHLDSTATRHIFADVPLWLLCPMHQG